MVRLFHLLLGSLGVQGDEDLYNDIRLTSCQAQILTQAGHTVDPSIVTLDVPCGDDDERALMVNNWDRYWDNYWRPEENKYIVPYFFDGAYTGDRGKIRAKLKDFEQTTCIKMEETESTDHGRLKIIDDDGCWSYVGRVHARSAGTEQKLSLSAGRCERGMVPLHEVMHALGFWHEHQRADRDSHVVINPDLLGNINYKRMDVVGYTQDTTLPSAYDFTSVMHYLGWVHTNGIPTIAKVTSPNTPIPAGYSDTFSTSDIAQMLYAYPCDTNECKEGTHQCHGYAKCVNDPSGYHCVCFPGLNGDGLTTGTGCNDVDECANGAHDCATDEQCINTPGSYRCSQTVDIVWTVDGTGSYKYYSETAKYNFKNQRDYLKDLNNGLHFRLGLTFFSDRWFASNEMVDGSYGRTQYALGIRLTDVNTLSDSAVDYAFDSVLPNLWSGGDMAEDVLSAIVFTRTDPNLGWKDDSIKQLHVFTDVIFHHKGCGHYDQYTVAPPLNQWTTQPASMYAYHDKTIVSAFTIGFKWNPSTGWYEDPAGIIDQIYFNVVACSASCQNLYDATFMEIPDDIDAWSPLSRSSHKKKSFTRVIISSHNIDEQFEMVMEKIEAIVKDTVDLIENIDECEMELHDCDYNAHCDDDIDGWICSCNDGWYGNGKICDDVDVCAGGTHGCGAHSTCVNGIGMSYECVCHTGYSPGSGGACVDVDECGEGSPGRRRRDIFTSSVESGAPPVGCAANSICINTEGSYYCVCDSMFRDESVANDGSLCKGPFCADEYVSMAEYDDIRTDDENGDVCYDIDECAEELDNCGTIPNSHCVNTAGDYSCPCNDGYYNVDGACVDTPVSKSCRDVTKRVTRTNSWTCRDCFNLRINVNLNNVRKAFNWNRSLYLSFTSETAVVKFAGPALSIQFDGRDFNGNYRYIVSFISGHEFGDNRIDFNAEFREMGNSPSVQWAWVCAKTDGVCDSVLNPYPVLGTGDWKCLKKRSGKITMCKAVCADGRNAYNGNTRVRCDTFTNKVRTAGEWTINRDELAANCKPSDAPGTKKPKRSKSG